MQIFKRQIFDEAISGTAESWVTAAEFNDLLGTADILVFMAQASNPTGTSPKLTVAVEHSADGRHWSFIKNLVNDQDISTPQLFKSFAGPGYLSLVRLKASLSGTAPQCRLKLFAVGRSL